MQSPQVSTTTPRTSRRLTSGAPLGSLQTPSRPPLAPPSFPPLSHLNLRPYNSHPYAVDLTFTTKLQEDRQAIDYAVQSTQQSLSNKKRDLQASLTEIDEERRRLEQATKGLGEQAKQLGEKQKQDLEEQRQHKLKRGQVEAATRDLQSQIEGVMLEIKEEQKKLAARRDIKARHREQFQSQLNKTAPELAFFEDKLGLRIRGIGKDLLQFKYTNLDSRNHQRVFAFSLDASKQKYVVSLLHPSPSYLPSTTLTPLVDQLNTSRDLYGFLRKMRRAFEEAVGGEKLGGPGAAVGGGTTGMGKD